MTVHSLVLEPAFACSPQTWFPSHPITPHLQPVLNKVTLGGHELDPFLGWGPIANLGAESSDGPEKKVKSAHRSEGCFPPFQNVAVLRETRS